MPRKTHTLRALDQPNPNGLSVPAPDSSSASLAPPLSPSAMEPPDNLVLVASLARSAGTPTTLISATWDAPTGVVVDKYTVQWSANSSFPDATTESADTFRTGATINGLVPLTLYYVRVSAWEHGVQSQWSSMVPLTTGVNRITTPADTVAPAVPTSAAAVFVNAGDLKITWVEPSLVASPNLRDVEVAIWNSSGKTINYLTDHSSTGQYIFTAAMNGEATSYAYDPTLYVELRARSWGNQYSAAVVVGTITKAVPANPVMTATWDGATGSLIFDWTDIADAASYELTLDGKLYPSATSKLVYDVARNRADHAGTPDPAITYLLKSVDRLAQRSTGVTATATLARPATPSGLTHTWSGDTGLSGPDLTISWTASALVASYELTLDGVARRLFANRYVLTLDANRAEHSGTPDPAISYSLVAVDGLGQTSTTPTTGTATNAAPPTTAIAIVAGFSALAVGATPSAAGDFRDYTFRIILGGVTQATYRSTNPDQLYKATVGGSYTVGVRVNDLFGQQSTETVSSAVVLDALTIEELRSELSYTSDDGQTQADLNKLKDGDTTVAATSHALSASAWRTITAYRALIYPYGQMTIFTGGIAAGTLKVYIGLSLDGVTWTWYSGALQPTGTTGQNTTLVAYGVEATAQTNAITLAATTAYRFDIPALTEARFVALKHRNTTGAYTFREFYPRRLLQTDDFQAESIMAINIGAAQVTADKISVLSLSSIVADVGKLTITNPAGDAWIYQGTGTGDSPTTGIKFFNVAGLGKIAGYDATVEQVAIDTDGRLKAGAGVVVLDATGVTITGPSFTYDMVNFSPVVVPKVNAIEWTETTADQAASIAGSTDGQLLVRGDRITLATPIPSTDDNYGLDLRVSGATSVYCVTFGVQPPNATVDPALLVTPDFTNEANHVVEVNAALNVGAATGAPYGGIKAIASDASTTTTATLLSLGHNSSGTPAAGFGIDMPINLESSTTADQAAALIRTTWVTATHASRAARMRFFVYDTAARTVMDLEASGSAPKIGFLGAAAVVRQNITGVSSGTPTAAQQAAVIRAILLAGANLGLWTDSTT